MNTARRTFPGTLKMSTGTPEARRFAHALGPQSKEQWQELYESGRLPADIPAGPHTVYRDKGWVSWPDWLGKKWRGFPEARRFVHALGLR
jgi:hypothetical protein